MFKRLLSAILSVAMIISAMTAGVFAAIPTDVIDTKYEEAAQVLGVLDIMVGDKDTGLFRPEDTIIRSEAARVAISALGLQDVATSTNGPTRYPDVSKDHWANGYINVATTQGLVIGDDLGNFRPDSNITYAEMVTILIRALGYEPMAKSKGSYPQGYLVAASNIGLTKGIGGNANEGIKRGDVARLVNNALTIKLMEQVGFGTDVKYEIVDKTLLKDNLDVEKITGQVTAVKSSALNGDSNLREDQVQIEDKIYLIGDADVREILGFTVDAYIKEDTRTGEKTLLTAIPVEGLNKSIKIDSDSIEEIVNEENDKHIKYWIDKDNDRSPKKLKIDKDAKIMYNGKTGSFEDFKTIESGYFTVLDSDTNGSYDVVFVNETVNYVVEEVIVNTNKIIDKYGQKTLVLDPEDTDLIFSIEKGTQLIGIKDLKEWDVLTVTQSKDGDFIHIEVSNESVSGKVTEIDDEKVYINGTGYLVASNYEETINLNDEGNFYLDVFGKIAGVDAKGTISTNYAYLNKIELSNGLNKVIELEIFDKNGKVLVEKTASKVKVNGGNYVTCEEAISLIGDAGQLITFERNSDGQINRIYTANNTSGAIDEENFSKNLVLSDAQYNANTNKLYASGKGVVVTEDTLVFDIPAGETDASEFSIRNMDFFIDDDKYDIIVFDMQRDLTAKAIIVTKSTGDANEASSIAVVDRITKTQNEDGVEIEKLYAIQNGKPVTFVTSESGILVKSNGESNVSLSQGDIIQFRVNAQGQIEKVNVLFDISTKDTEKENVISEDLATYYGKVTDKFSKTFNLKINDGEEMNFNYTQADVYIVDLSKNNNRITVGDSGDIQKYDDLDPERVFVRVYKDIVEEIVIIR
ncbi:MAG: S-layer homology domain-containing protein [Ruminococcaceae bacterium]|nr:S-layer homology domain-containing protein [Oscillospiraceae bacterium]